MTAGTTALRAGIHFIVPVWGGEYTRCFTEICLPTFLAPGNIPALPNPDQHVFQIYTTPRDRAAIEASPAYHQLIRHLKVTFHRVRVAEPTRHINPLAIQSDCYRRAIRAADAAGRAMFFMTPDMIMADGSLRHLAAVADRPNVRAILGTGVRLVKEAVVTRLLEHHRARDQAITVGPRDMVRMILDHLHPMAKSHFYRPDEGNDRMALSNLYWRAGNEGIVARCFHLHPFLVYPRVKNAPFSATVDGDYIEVACPDLSDVHVLTDSDDFCVCELSAGSRTWEPALRTEPLTRFMKWLRDSTTPRHRSLVTKPIHLRADFTDAALWQQKDREADETVGILMAHLRAAGFAGSDADTGAGYVDAVSVSVPLLFATAIRSEAEARCFAQLTLPSLLAPVNIARQVNKRFCGYRIVATAQARAVIEAAPALAELCDHIAVEIETRDPSAMRGDGFPDDFRGEIVAIARQARAAAMFIEPDSVLCDNGLSIINAALGRKMRAMLAPRLRLGRAAAMPLLRDRVIENVLSISATDLVGFALEHPHPLTLAQFRDGEGDRMDPAAMSWRVGDEGVMMHAFEYAPIMIYPRDEPPAADAVDHPLLGALGFGPHEISLIRDSKAFVLCQLDDEGDTAPLLPRGDAAAVADWAAAHTCFFQRVLFKHEIRLVATDTPSKRWDEVAAIANAEVVRVLGALARVQPQPRRA